MPVLALDKLGPRKYSCDAGKKLVVAEEGGGAALPEKFHCVN